jgi:hypothetical protein
VPSPNQPPPQQLTPVRAPCSSLWPRARFRRPSGSPPEILPVDPERVERSVVEVAAAGEEPAEVLPTLGIKCHYFAIQNRLFDSQLFPDPVAELLKMLQDVSPLRAEVAALTGDIEQAAEPIVLGLEQICRIVERLFLWRSADQARRPGRSFERPARRPRTDLLLMSPAVYALEEAGLCLMRQAPGELSAPDTECAGHNEPEARDPERSVPPADHRRPMGQHPCEMEQGDEPEQSSGDNQIGSHRRPPDLWAVQRLDQARAAV